MSDQAEQESATVVVSDEVHVDVQGHIAVPLDGTEFVLRPSFKALQAIERLTGKDHAELTHLAVQQRMSYDDMSIIIAEMMKAHGEANPNDPLKTTYLNTKPEKLGPLIMSEGKTKICIRLAILLVASLSGGYTPEGELKATRT
jgi:hypothetical protein